MEVSGSFHVSSLTSVVKVGGINCHRKIHLGKFASMEVKFTSRISTFMGISMEVSLLLWKLVKASMHVELLHGSGWKFLWKKMGISIEV